MVKDQAKGGLGQWVEEKCREEKLSLRQAAEKTGLSHSTIADVMKGVRPSAETIKKLAQAFSGNGSTHRLILEDRLLVLAGYRTPRPEGDEPSELVAQLLDKLGQFSEPELKLVRHFVNFVAEMEKK